MTAGVVARRGRASTPEAGDRTRRVRQAEEVTSGISSSFDDGLGVLAHGPRVLSTGPGIGIGLRCVFAHLDGLLLSVQVKAVGQTARDAYESDVHPGSRSGRRHRPRLPRSDVRLSVPASAAGLTPDGELWLRLHHRYDSAAHTARGYSDGTPEPPPTSTTWTCGGRSCPRTRACRWRPAGPSSAHR